MNAPAFALRPTSTDPIDVLAADWLKAKADESQANKRRLEIEKQILAATAALAVTEGTAKAEGQEYNVTIAFKMTRSIDQRALESRVAGNVGPEILNRLFVYSPKLDIKELRYLQDNEPDVYVKVSECITAKPSKPAISVKAVA